MTDANSSIEKRSAPRREQSWRRHLPSGLSSFSENPVTLLGVGIVVALVAVAVVGPFVVPHDPFELHLDQRLEPPSMSHPLGTDQLGRDLLSRLVYGARISLGLALAVTAVRLLIGTLVGLVAGYLGGRVDEALMRVVDVLLAFPGFVLALVVAGILGPSLPNVLIALALVGWSSYARLVRGSVLSVKNREFVTASRLQGSSHLHVAARHVLPNVISPVVVLATLDLGGVILATSGLSFLGLGAQPPTPEWGTMLASGRNYLREAWWLANVPGVAIMLTVLGFNLLGDGLRDALDPKHEAQIDQL